MTEAESTGPGALSAREEAALRLFAWGYTAKEVGPRLGVNHKTAEVYNARGMEKLGLRTRVDLVRQAQRSGWFADDPAAGAEPDGSSGGGG